MASAQVIGGRATAMLRRALPLRAGVAADYSAVLGVAPRGQLRRGFAAYLENERAHPFRTFLHYNSWYDIGYFTPYSQDDALRVIAAYGQQLVRDRGVHPGFVPVRRRLGRHLEACGNSTPDSRTDLRR